MSTQVRTSGSSSGISRSRSAPRVESRVGAGGYRAATTSRRTLAPLSFTASTILIKRAQKTLKIMQWSHFVPAYDAWFDKYAKDWGTQKGVEVTVDHIALADLTTRANAEVAAQQGHDLFQFLSPPGAFEPQVLDMADVVQIGRAH